MVFTRNKRYFFVSAILFNFSYHAAAIPVPDGDGNSNAWIAQYTVNSSFAKVGKPLSLQWQAFYAVGCSVTTNQTGSRSVPTSGTTTVTPTSPTTMSVTLRCTGTNGQATSRTRSFSVNRFDHPELLSLNVSQTTAQIGETVRISWSSAFSDYCRLSGTNVDTLPNNGSRDFFVRQGANRFDMVCSKYDSRTSNPLSRTVTGQNTSTPIITHFYPQDFGYLDPDYRLIWNTSANSCTLDGRSVPPSGSQIEQKGLSYRRHTLRCTRNGVIATRSTSGPRLEFQGIAPLINQEYQNEQ